MVDNSSLILNEKKNARKFSLILNDFLEILVFLKQFYIVPIIKISRYVNQILKNSSTLVTSHASLPSSSIIDIGFPLPPSIC